VIYLPIVVAGAQTPADMILTSVRQKPLSLSEIEVLFSQELLIDHRLKDLVKASLIKQKKPGSFVLTPKGTIAYQLIMLSTWLVGIGIGG